MADVFLTEGEIRQLKTVLAERESLRKQLADAISKLNELARKFNLHTHDTCEMGEMGKCDNEGEQTGSEYHVDELEWERLIADDRFSSRFDYLLSSHNHCLGRW